MPAVVSGWPRRFASCRRLSPTIIGSVCRYRSHPAWAEAATALLPPPVLSEPIAALSLPHAGAPCVGSSQVQPARGWRFLGRLVIGVGVEQLGAALDEHSVQGRYGGEGRESREHSPGLKALLSLGEEPLRLGEPGENPPVLLRRGLRCEGEVGRGVGAALRTFRCG
jgi:hypothetical protein